MTTPSEPIVVGILDPASETALLEHAGRLATASGRPLRLVHVHQANVLFGDPILGLPGAMQPQSMLIDDSAVGRLTAELLRDATEIARRVVADDVEVSGELLRGHAAHMLIKESEGAHRVVLQRRQLSRVHRVFTGSISTRVAAHAHCPVTIVPEGWSPEGRTGVVVGVSGDKTDDEVLGYAFDEASRLNEPVTVLHGLDLMALNGELADHATTREWLARGEKHLADLVERAGDQHRGNTPTQVKSQVLAEAPADALVAAGEAARLLVVGRASHLNAYPHLGGVTRALLREAACPVDVLPLPA